MIELILQMDCSLVSPFVLWCWLQNSNMYITSRDKNNQTR